MAKTYIDTVKYVVYTNVEISGLVEKPDVVGAIFGQTEGLLGDELDLRDLQKNGRIGRIEVDLSPNDGKTVGVIKIPSSLDMVETCIIAAALETVDRVGPCEARLRITKVEDTRNVKRKVLVDRAKFLLKTLLKTEIPESKEISEMVRDEVKTAEVVDYGADRLAAGPGIDKTEEVIFVEGRADVINLLKNDITNVIAIGGARVTKTIIDLSKRKEVTLFLDGDRGGDMILNELVQNGVDIDYICRAPAGVEVEELTRKEIIKYIRNKTPFEQISGVKRPERRRQEIPKFRMESEDKTYVPPTNDYEANQSSSSQTYVETDKSEKPSIIKEVLDVVEDANTVTARENRERHEQKERKFKKEHQQTTHVPKVVIDSESTQPSISSSTKKPHDRESFLIELDSLSNTLKARFYSNGNRVLEVPVRDVIKSLGEVKAVDAIVFDGIITQRLVDLASRQGVKVLVGIKVGNVNKTPENIEILTKSK